MGGQSQWISQKQSLARMQKGGRALALRVSSASLQVGQGTQQSLGLSSNKCGDVWAGSSRPLTSARWTLRHPPAGTPQVSGLVRRPGRRLLWIHSESVRRARNPTRRRKLPTTPTGKLFCFVPETPERHQEKERSMRVTLRDIKPRMHLSDDGIFN
ncbi:uncharacterized protein WM277_017820 [Molossus nigricans]